MTTRQTNVKAEFYWSRLAYNSRMAAASAVMAASAVWRPRLAIPFLVARLSQGRPPVSDRDEPADAHRGTSDGAGGHLDTDEIFNYPWIYAVQVQTWTFTDDEAKRLREYLLKGGFLMVDDFHGTEDWENFMNGMRQVLPGPAGRRPAEQRRNLPRALRSGRRCRFPASNMSETGRTYEKDGYEPKWRAIRDDKGRIMVAICHNMHLGDAWEWADDPDYPETVRFDGLPRGAELHHLRHDALRSRRVSQSTSQQF